MQTVELTGNKREISTKGALRSLRVKGEIPAVVYGGADSSKTLSVNGKEFRQLLKAHGTNMVVSLKLDSKTETVLVKQAQRDPLTRDFVHVDFQRISLTEKIEVSVPLRVKGEAPGVKLSGGILEHILREVKVTCLPTDIPHALDVDVSSLQINQGIKVKDLTLPKGIEMVTDAEHLVINIVSPKVEEAPAPAEAAAAAGAAEPEVIAKGKKPEEGEEGAAPAAGGKAAPAAGGKAAPAAGKEGKK
ncbi:MAG: 50S ribosomal protein L25 [Elusimicrobia bacterium]|nr:50S ribosomal protein L25 [Elusimicrobiota bacterium]